MNSIDPTVKKIRNITWWGLWTNLALSILKFFLGFLGRSQAVIADAVHSLSDISTDLMILFGIKYWSAPPDDNHPYGHQQFESMVTTAIAVVLAIVAIGLGYNSLSALREQDYTIPLFIAVIGPALSIILKEILFQKTIRIGRKSRSSSLIANAWHHRSDVLSSIPPLLAVTISTIDARWAFLDRVAAIIVALFILKVSLDIIKPVFKEFTLTGLPEEEIKKITGIVLSMPGIRGVHSIRSRRIGSDVYIDLHIQVDGKLTVREGHKISERVSEKLVEECSDLFDVVTHLEPFNP